MPVTPRAPTEEELHEIAVSMSRAWEIPLEEIQHWLGTAAVAAFDDFRLGNGNETTRLFQVTFDGGGRATYALMDQAGRLGVYGYVNSGWDDGKSKEYRLRTFILNGELYINGRHISLCDSTDLQEFGDAVASILADKEYEDGETIAWEDVRDREVRNA